MRPKLYQLGFNHPPHTWSNELRAECTRLELALYSMPAAVGAAPSIFSGSKEADPQPMSLDEDGLEVVADCAALGRYHEYPCVPVSAV